MKNRLFFGENFISMDLESFFIKTILILQIFVSSKVAEKEYIRKLLLISVRNTLFPSEEEKIVLLQLYFLIKKKKRKVSLLLYFENLIGLKMIF
jgi:hypothetical protein